MNGKASWSAEMLRRLYSVLNANWSAIWWNFRVTTSFATFYTQCDCFIVQPEYMVAIYIVQMELSYKMRWKESQRKYRNNKNVPLKSSDFISLS